MLIVLVIAAIAIQFFAAESQDFQFGALLAPFIFIALPMLALTAALAVLFETIGFLQGGLGNVIYFFIYLFIFPLSNTLSKVEPALEPLGFGLLEQSMGAAAKAAFPDYDGGFVLGSSDIPIKGIFTWAGVAWNTDLILKRFAFFGIAMAITLIASLFFDRFDPSRYRPRQVRKAAQVPETAPAAGRAPLTATPEPIVPTRPAGFGFGRILISELKLLLKGKRWWWYAVAGGLAIAALVNGTDTVRMYILPVTWLWPILIWSGLGNREVRFNTQQMVFSSSAPLAKQLPATWLAGMTVTVITGSGAALKILSAGDATGMLAWASAALFIPSLALALGIWSHSNKLFEIVYVIMWYFGPMNKILALDYLGANSSVSTTSMR